MSKRTQCAWAPACLLPASSPCCRNTFLLPSPICLYHLAWHKQVFSVYEKKQNKKKKRQGENLEGKAFERSCLSKPLSLGSLGTSTHHRWLSGPGPARGPWGSAWSLWSGSGVECSTLNPPQAFSYSSILSPITLTTALLPGCTLLTCTQQNALALVGEVAHHCCQVKGAQMASGEQPGAAA